MSMVDDHSLRAVAGVNRRWRGAALHEWRRRCNPCWTPHQAKGVEILSGEGFFERTLRLKVDEEELLLERMHRPRSIFRLNVHGVPWLALIYGNAAKLVEVGTKEIITLANGHFVEGAGSCANYFALHMWDNRVRVFRIDGLRQVRVVQQGRTNHQPTWRVDGMTITLELQPKRQREEEVEPTRKMARTDSSLSLGQSRDSLGASGD